MQHTLKLTITAVGENDSIFLTPCEPVTLHESCVEDLDADDEAAARDIVLSEPAHAGDIFGAHVSDDVMVMIDE